MEKKDKQGFVGETYETHFRELRGIAMQKLLGGNLMKAGYFKRDYIVKALNALPNPRLSLDYGVILKRYEMRFI